MVIIIDKGEGWVVVRDVGRVGVFIVEIAGF